MKILTFTSLFPNSQQPLQNPFVWERTNALAQLCELQVVAPVPFSLPIRWLGERYYRLSQVPENEKKENVIIFHPRFVIIPKVFKYLDGILMAVCSLVLILSIRRRFRFDLIDAQWAYPDGFAAALIAAIVGVPFSITVRGDDINVFAKVLWRRYLIRWTLKRAAVVIALSEDLKRETELLGIMSGKIAVIPNGIDPSMFYPIDKSSGRGVLGLSPEWKILLAVGRLHSSKGFTTLVEALAKLKHRFPNVYLIIAGGPDHEANAEPAIRKMAMHYGIVERVILVGSQTPQQLLYWYSAADLFCLPTLREGSANVLLEALACGLPCITTPVGGNPDIITHSKLGQLVQPDAQSMADAIADGLSRNWDGELIASYGRRRTWKQVAEDCYNLFSSQLLEAQRYPPRECPQANRSK